VLVVHNRYRSSAPSGEDRVVDQETAALAAQGCEVERFERLSDEIPSLPLAEKLMVPVRVAWNPSANRALAGAIDAFRPDVVHAHNVYPLLSPSVLHEAAKRAPVVVTVHNYRPLCPTGQLFRSGAPCTECVGRAPFASVRHGCYRDSRSATVPMAVASLVQRRAWRDVPSAYIFISAAQRDLFAPLGLPEERCFVKGNLVHASPVDAPTEPLVAFVGRLDEAKGVRLLMDGWDRFSSRRPTSDLRLAIAGSGPLEPEVRTWAARRQTVDVLGLLSREQCANLTARARAVVVPSVWQEPFGLVVAEAMAAGTPPIAPAHGAFPELIHDGIDGELFPPGDPDALSRTLERVGDDPDRCSRLGRSARLTHAERFAPDKNTAELLAVYRFAIEHPTEVTGRRTKSGERAVA
jgi:glycosyltransferase involved in cell wall biosynthesis